jgi:penicillin-binding protein 1B
MAQAGKSAGGFRRLTLGAPVRRLLLRSALALAVVVAGAFSIAFIDANWRFARQGPAAPIRLYSAPFLFKDGASVTPADLSERLTRLGYRRIEGRPRTPGEFSQRFRSFEIALNRFEYPEGAVEPTTVRVRVSSGHVTNVEDAETGRNLESARIEPEPLGVLSGGAHEERVPVSVAEMPLVLKQAVIAVEDRRFFSHPGVDLKGILRALFANLKSGEVVQGGSTITQQLAKNLYENHESRTLTRKLWETLAALSLEVAHSKDQILERYLNEVYLAQRGPFAVIGVGAAAQHYFGKEARYLDLPEAALLAGLIQSPGRYHPYRNPTAARERRDVVLGLMRQEKMIADQEHKAAAATPLRLRPEPSNDPRQAPYFADYIHEVLRQEGVKVDASAAGLRVFTTLDPLLQARAEASLEERLRSYEKGYRHLRRMPGGELQGAVVALRPADGAILAMVGGRDYQQTQFNRTVQAHRQPGSLFKPFVYLAGLREAQEAGDSRFTAATVLDDSPLEMVVGGKPWAPHNFDEEFRGPVTARQALAHSLNIPTIRAAEDIGLNEVVRTARRCGIEGELQPVPSLALGTFEVSPLEIASAFSTFANLGERAEAHGIAAIVDGHGKVQSVESPTHHVTTPQAAYLTLDLMRDVLRYGTGAAASSYGIEADLAGKTGTTDEGRDAWFVGFSPDVLALVWVGFDNNRPLRLGGSTLALPIWGDFMARAGLDHSLRWEEPEGIVHVEVDPTTGKLATWRCPESIEEMFIEGTEPDEQCEHGNGFTSWAKRLFGWLRRQPGP